MPRAKHDLEIRHPNRPSIRDFQEAESFSGTVPEFIEKLERGAHEAGLAVEKVSVRGYSHRHFAMVCSGSAAQIEAFSFLDQGVHRWPSGIRNRIKLLMTNDLPVAHQMEAALYRLASNHYALVIRHDLPSKWSVIEGDIEKYQYAHEDVFVGTKENLLELPFVNSEAFPEPNYSQGCVKVRLGPWCFHTEQARQLDDGRFVYWRNLDHIRHMEEYKAENDGRAQFNHPSEWLERMEDFICTATRTLRDESLAKVETKSGATYSASLADLGQIASELELVAQKLRDVRVTVTYPPEKQTTPQMRSMVLHASSDAQFQQFMHQAQGKAAS